MAGVLRPLGWERTCVRCSWLVCLWFWAVCGELAYPSSVPSDSEIIDEKYFHLHFTMRTRDSVVSPGHTASKWQIPDPSSSFLGPEHEGSLQVEERALEVLRCYLYSHLLSRSLGDPNNVTLLPTQVLNCQLKKKHESCEFQVYLGTYLGL